MAEAEFFDAAGRSRTADAIRDIESHTAAEVIVQVRHAAGRYRDADYLWGFGFALAVLLVLLYAPRAFPLIGFPVQTALAFIAGAALSSRVPALRRRLIARRTMEQEVRRAARSAFHDLGVARCSGRWGLLVLVATFERRVEVVTDLGIDTAALGEAWNKAIEAMNAAVRRRDFTAFLDALRTLGPTLGSALPRREDDVDELGDEVAAESAGDGAGA